MTGLTAPLDSLVKVRHADWLVTDAKPRRAGLVVHLTGLRVDDSTNHVFDHMQFVSGLASRSRWCDSTRWACQSCPPHRQP